MEMEYIDSVKFFLNNNLIIGHDLPEKGYKPTPKDLTKLGLFDSSAPNYVNYDPSVSKEDFNPKDEDFIHPEFRLLSETVVHPYFPIDFGQDSVLKGSMSLLPGSGLYPDHEASVGNSLGVIESVYWEDSYKVDGVTIPAGINGKLKLDGKANPRIARLILMKPPGISSTSVTVQFKWKKSHEVDGFFDKLGTYDEKGELIRRIVTEILGYPEVSLVTNGADKFAKMKTDKGIAGVNRIASNSFFFDFRKTPEQNEELIKSFSLTPSKDMTKIEQIGQEMAKRLNLDLEAFDIEKLSEILDGAFKPQLPENIEKLMETYPQLTVADVEGLKQNQLTDEQKQTLESALSTEELESLKAKAQVGEDTLKALRETTISNYKLAAGKDNENEVVIGILNKANHLELLALNRDYEEKLELLSPLTCQECNSTKIERRSSSSNIDPKDPTKGRTEDRLYKKFQRKPSSLHTSSKES
jgi:hypothetical protein